jgi:ABC-type multidrug transport system ATPase subunit
LFSSFANLTLFVMIYSRRFVWRHIDEIKDGRVVLLTTHAMEEADLLADEVAILRKGEIAAVGSPLSLKAEHGSALQFSLLVETSDVTKTDAMIRSYFRDDMDWVDIDAGAAGNVNVHIHKVRPDTGGDGVSVELLSGFVAWLEGDESPVTEYGFSNSSLEEVFLKVTGEGHQDGVAAALGNGKAPRTLFPLQSKKSTPRYPMRKLQRFVPI